ncbi:helix-turn-helix domain-containing protein [Haploplasma modicum]|jgi:transcriptional regulator with XRE-family HTH domain|uniref:helix-turn-helix domain-containing protein n=1 Tax=Haploplasma modicum TaxID=2150 RepID=UPI00047CF0E1|nr:XRE family transcriptional regulator [Haploplasma modicum]MCR1809385.1 XRE family transcriptional regulator [Haploplasma modicum]
MVDIGKKIRALRLGNGLTQDELASRLELTKGYISQLENNLTSPSIQTLFALLEVLGTNIHEFFANEQEINVVFKKEDFFEKENDDLKHRISWIVPNALKYQMEPIIINLEAGGQSTIDDPHNGEEFGYVLEGQVTLVLNKKRYIIKKGETFYYMANKEHYIVNNGNTNAKVLWISTPPMF